MASNRLLRLGMLYFLVISLILGFRTSLFVKHAGSDFTYVLIYVDDIIVTGTNTSYISSLLHQLQSKFALKYLGDLHYFLGIEVVKDDSGLFLTQKKICFGTSKQGRYGSL